MWYFRKYFGYQVSGLEYVDWCAAAVEQSFADFEVPVEVFQEDLFSIRSNFLKRRFDVVFSRGFVEHFHDTKMLLKCHAELCRPGGYVVILIPNHAGIYGRIMKLVAPEKHEMHNLMDIEQLFEGADMAGVVPVSRGSAGRAGFWNTCLYETVKPKGRFWYTLVRGACWLLEPGARLLPRSKALSPNIYLVARVP